MKVRLLSQVNSKPGFHPEGVCQAQVVLSTPLDVTHYVPSEDSLLWESNGISLAQTYSISARVLSNLAPR